MQLDDERAQIITTKKKVMKKKLYTTVVFMMLITTTFAQFELKIDPVSALFGVIPISGEYVIKDNIGIEGTIDYYFKKDNTFSDATKSSGFITNGLFKFYFKPERGGDKFYGFPYVRYVNRKVSFVDNGSDITATYTAFGVGFGIGYKWVAEKGILIDIGFGAGRNFAGGYTYDDPNYTNSEAELIPISVMGRLSLGYRF